MSNKKLTTISTFALVMLISGAIDSLRNLPTTALFGSSIIFFFVVAAVFFLLPISLISAELTVRFSEDSGVYGWVKRAFGAKIAFLAIWLQWINTMVWYPTILSFVAGLIAYLINPNLIENKLFLVSVILIIFWVSTILNLKGIKTSTNFATICGVLGMVLPMIFICALGLFWFFSGKPLQIHLTASEMLPSFSQGNSWVALTAIITSFLGMELATVHVKQIKKAKEVFPKALCYSVVLVFFTMILGSLAIAFVLPKNEINLVGGIIQAFSMFLAAYHLSWLTPVIALLIIIGSIGSLTNWIISPAKGLFLAAQDNFLPVFLQKQNKSQVPYNLLITQAVIVSLVCLVFLLMPGVNGAYWLLTDLSTQLYVLMYFIMFLAAIALQSPRQKQKVSCIIPGGWLAIVSLSLLGVIGCLVALAVGFIPPTSINVGGNFNFELLFCVGLFIMIVPVLGCFIIKNKRLKQAIITTQ